jgi:hypothetical protein
MAVHQKQFDQVSAFGEKSARRANEVSPSSAHHLNQIELARRWRVSPRTLERWRWQNQGPKYLKIGGRVVYRMTDIEAFEAIQAHG